MSRGVFRRGSLLFEVKKHTDKKAGETQAKNTSMTKLIKT